MKWNDLNIKDKAAVIKEAYKSGLRSLSDIRMAYDAAEATETPVVPQEQPDKGIVNYSSPNWSNIVNMYYRGGDLGVSYQYSDGGRLTFNEWKAKMQTQYPDIEMDNKKAGYDYNTYFNNHYDDAIRQLTNLQHFPDAYKLPSHPTFSNESIYSAGPVRGGSWNSDGSFSPSVINTVAYPNIYDRNGSFTEQRIYNRFPHQYPDGGGLNGVKLSTGETVYPASDYYATDEDNSLHAAKIMLNPVKVLPPSQDYLMQFAKQNPKAFGAVESFDPDAVAWNNTAGLKLMAGLTGTKMAKDVATLPFKLGKSTLKTAFAHPIQTITGFAGGLGTDAVIRHTTPYKSWGNMLANKVFNTDNPLLTFGMEMTNPFGWGASWYGNEVDRRLVELLVRRGDYLKNGINTTKHLFKHLFPDVGPYVQQKTGFKHPVLRYVLDPRQKDLVYKLNDAPPQFGELLPAQFQYGYDGSYSHIPYKGDIVDIFMRKGINNTGRSYTREIPYYFKDYMKQNYPHQKPFFFNLGEASVNTPRAAGAKYRNDVTEGIGVVPDGGHLSFIDPGGFNLVKGSPERTWFADIWKYNGEDAIKRYGDELSYVPAGQQATLRNKAAKPLIRWFGNYVDAHSTPIITQWHDSRPIFGLEQKTYASGGDLDGVKLDNGQVAYPASNYYATDDDRSLHAAKITLNPVKVTAEHPIRKWDRTISLYDPNFNQLYQHYLNREKAGKKYLKRVAGGLSVAALPMGGAAGFILGVPDLATDFAEMIDKPSINNATELTLDAPTRYGTELDNALISVLKSNRHTKPLAKILQYNDVLQYMGAANDASSVVTGNSIIEHASE